MTVGPPGGGKVSPPIGAGRGALGIWHQFSAFRLPPSALWADTGHRIADTRTGGAS